MADGDDIKHKLKAFQPREAAALALRAAMRILPVLAMRAKAGDDPFAYWPAADRSAHVLSILRCYQISIFGQNLPRIDPPTTATFRAATTAANRAEAASATFTVRAVYAAAYAATIATARSITPAAHAAPASALSAIRATRAAARASITDTAIDADLEFFKRNRNIRELLNRRLWAAGMPDEIERIWLQLIADLRSLKDYYDVWIIWYQERLEGRPMHPGLESRWALLPAQIQDREPAHINTFLMRVWGEFSPALDNDDPDETPPEMAEQQEAGFPYPQGPAPGSPYSQVPEIRPEFLQGGQPLGFDQADAMPPEIPEPYEPAFPYTQNVDYPGTEDAEDYQVELSPSGSVEPDDASEIAALRTVLLKAVDNLLSVVAMSTELAWVAAIARDYRDAIMTGGAAIDDIYGYGAWLEQARNSVNAQSAAGDGQGLAPAAVAAINTIIAIHGPMIASTVRGRELMACAREFAEHQAETAKFKLNAGELAAIVKLAHEAAAKQVEEEIEQANDNIDSDPQRGTT